MSKYETVIVSGSGFSDTKKDMLIEHFKKQNIQLVFDRSSTMIVTDRRELIDLATYPIEKVLPYQPTRPAPKHHNARYNDAAKNRARNKKAKKQRKAQRK